LITQNDSRLPTPDSRPQKTSDLCKKSIEIVSTNWRDDYRIKLNEYETLGILEYWIVDYAGLGGVQYIGSPKQPTVTINYLIDGEYQSQRYQGDATIISPTFPQLELTTNRIVAILLMTKR
jgi:Uma2 family endonuclease